MKIILQPATADLVNNTLYHLARDILVEFEDAKVTVASSIKPQTEVKFQLALDKHRNQSDSFELLEWFVKKFKAIRGTKILAIFDIDAYSSGFDFVFGEAFYK